MMAVDLGLSQFDPGLMGDNIESLSTGNAVGFGYAINYQGNENIDVGSGGLARTAADNPVRNFTSLAEMEISSVSKTVTATAILRLLQSRPGGLDAALKTRLNDYLPSDWNPGANTQFITLRHLLTHTSGLSESSNAINVEFESYGNNTYANLRNLIQTGLPAPNVAADSVYDGPRWNLNTPGGNYNNANFTLLARVVLPKLLSPNLDLTSASFPGTRDAVSGAIYRNYVRDNIFEPMGIVGADLDVDDANPVKGYTLATAQAVAGGSQGNLTSTGGAFGWKLDARELGVFLDAIRRDNSILWASTRQMRDDQELGWFQSEDAFGEYFGHNGATTTGGGNFRSKIEAMPGAVEVSYLMNSEDDNLPGGSIGAMLKTAYVNAWTDLTVSGTPGNDTFEIRLVPNNGRSSIQVRLNGDVEFTRWIDSFDSLTLNAQQGNDTFNILGWNPTVDLIVNGGSGNDVVNLLPSVENIESVNGMQFNGGTGVDSIVVEDQDNPYSMPGLSQLYTVTSTGVSRHRGISLQNLPLIPVPVSIGYSGVENLDLTTGGQADIVTLASKTSGETVLRTGTGDDVIRVAHVAGNLQLVDGLRVEGGTGTDSLELFDQNKVINGQLASAHYDVTSTQVERYTQDLGGIAIDPTPTKYKVEYGSIENLALTTTNAVDHIRVHSTPSGETIVHGGAGSDVLYASPNAKNLETVRDLTFHGDAGVDAIMLYDENNPYSHPTLSNDYNVTASQVARSMRSFGFTFPVDVSYSSVEEMTLHTGQQGDVVNVDSVPSGKATVRTGEGNDVVNASPTAGNLETVNDLLVDGGLGADSLVLRDVNNPYGLGAGSGVYTISTDQVKRLAEHLLFDNVVVPVVVDFANLENVSLAAGNQGDVFNVSGTGSPAALLLDGNSGADAFHIDGPAFASINVQGDAPFFLPGDQLFVNESGLYPVAPIPGLYVAGSGGVTLGASSIHYSGIETSDIQSQIYGGPGDFDSNGLVDGIDLSHATLGWDHRFGGDLDGFNFLAWQSNFGVNRLPAEGGVAVASVALASGGGASEAFADLGLVAPEQESAPASAAKVFVEAALPLSRPLSAGRSTSRRATWSTTGGAEFKAPLASSPLPSSHGLALAELATTSRLSPAAADDRLSANDQAIDEAFGSWRPAMRMAL